MAAIRVMIVSDSHLSERTPEATANWNALIDHADDAQPDAIIHTGDIALDGTAGAEELGYVRRELDRMSAAVLALPGNHDVGDNPCETNAGSPYLINSERVAAYRDYVGVDRWASDVGSWRLVGLNAQLLESGLPEEDEQWNWLEQELAPERLEGRNAAMFLHKPLWHSDPQLKEDDEPIRYVRPEARERLSAMYERVGAKLVVSGHVHQHRHINARGMEHVWAPTAWATLPEAMQQTIGERWVGGLDLMLGEDGSVAVAPIRPPGVGQHVIGETIPNPYGH